MAHLSFITDKNLLAAVRKVIQKIENAQKGVDATVHKNVLDPFSALFDGITHGISYKEWIKLEKVRQMQKTMQNAIGDFHQDILGSVRGCKSLGVGGGLDVCFRKKNIIAEVKINSIQRKGTIESKYMMLFKVY